MSCYFRHLKDIFAAAGIQVTPANRKRLDLAIQRIVGTEGKHCPETWQKLKQDILPDERKRQELVAKLRAVGR